MPHNAPESAKRPPLHAGEPASPTDHFRDAAARLAEIKDYAAYYASAKVDSYKSAAKSLALYAVLGALAAVAGLAILTTAGVLLVVGIAQALTALFNGHAWIANLVTGLLLLGGTLAATYFLVHKLLGKSRLATKKKYEDLKREHLIKYGHNVHERATHAQSQ